MNSKSIYRCLNCDDNFCSECSDSSNWESFCSSECQEKYLAPKLSKNIDRVFEEGKDGAK